MFFELVSILFAIVPYYGKLNTWQKKIQIEPVLKILQSCAVTMYISCLRKKLLSIKEGALLVEKSYIRLAVFSK